MGSEELKEAIGRLVRASRLSPEDGRKGAVNVAPGCAFGAVVDQRLKDIEGSLSELRSRLNGLIFIIVGAVLIEVVMRLVR